MSLVVSQLTAGVNSHTETSENANAVTTDFASSGIVGAITATSGIAPMTGGFAVNAQGTPDMTVAISSGTAYVSATPTSQGSQKLRVKNSASTNITIAANASGSTKYDWVYISISATNAANPAVNGDNVATLVTSRSSNSITDDGTPPTYGYCIAVVTVANGASSITNGNIADKRVRAAMNNTVSFSGTLFDFVESGCVWTADSAGSTLNASMSAGYVWIAGVRLSVSAVSAKVFAASTDTYVDLSDNGDGTAAISYNSQTNNAASPALASGAVRIAIIVSGASNIAASTSINQGQETMVLPIASSIPYAVTDSLGNLICPRDPSRKMLGYRQVISGQGTITTETDITGLTVPVIVPVNRKIEISCDGETYSSVAGDNGTVKIKEGATALTQYDTTYVQANTQIGSHREIITTPATGLHTYKISLTRATGTGNLSTFCSSTNPMFIKVKLL